MVGFWAEWRGLLAVAALSCSACARPAVPDPKVALARYAEALRRGDDDAVWSLLSQDSQRDLGRATVKRLLAEQHSELAQGARGLVAPGAVIQISATTRFVDGETATFSVEDGQLRLQSAAALPAHATTPQQALAELRAVLARRSYAGLMGVLSQSSAAALEVKLRALVTGLQDPETLEIVVESDRAVVELAGGHRVELIKDHGLWKIHDFE